MGLIEKLKLLFKVRQPATDLINEVKEIKTGYKTIQFWVTVIGTIGSVATAMTGLIPATAALVISTSLTCFYNILRGATKSQSQTTKPILQTTEFWMSMLTELSNTLITFQNGAINPPWFATAQATIAAFMAFGQNLASQAPSGTTTPVAPK